MSDDDVFSGVGVEIEFDKREDFLKIKETLTRIGVASKSDNNLYQSCHILHKKGRYAILHFKELFILDGKKDNTFIDENDYGRRNVIIRLLQDWKLLRVISTKRIDDPVVPLSEVKIIPFNEKKNWNLVSKYTIGGRK